MKIPSSHLQYHFQVKATYNRYHQRFLFELGMKPHMHLVKIRTFSLNNVTVKPTKIMNKLQSHQKLGSFLENEALKNQIF